MINGSVKGWQFQTSSPMYNVRSDAVGKDTKESKIIAWKAVCSSHILNILGS